MLVYEIHYSLFGIKKKIIKTHILGILDQVEFNVYLTIYEIYCVPIVWFKEENYG